jgi:hypothetical protein
MTIDDATAKRRADVIYSWPRFWVPRDSVIDLSDAGFLRDPEDWLGSHEPAQLQALRRWKSLVLLGEPGIGKSTTLQEEASRVALLNAGNVSIYADLRNFSSEPLLYQRVFESEKFLEWKNGSSQLFLHLDSLDEALLRIDSIANLLGSVFPELPTERMSIRIGCRTAVWPTNTLGASLNRIWGDASGVFELAPLRRKDVFTALEASGITAEDFMRALFAAQAVPFAIKPLTLKMLMTIFQRDGSLPTSNIDLYKRGCLALCDEQNKSRRDSGRRGRLNASQRLRLAGRVAAATILGNRFAVWTGPEVDCPIEDVPISTLAGHRREEGEFASFDVTDNDVREVLDTGLFSSRGDDRMGWAHQGYGEFLSALYLYERGVPAETTLKTLIHPAGGLIPQLSIVAAWAASLSNDLRKALVADEPLVLLRGDLSSWNAVDRAALVKSLLNRFEGKKETESPYGNAEAYSNLNYSGLGELLRPFVTNRDLNLVTRRLALIIAEKCCLKELQPELLQVALDPADDPHVRAGAVSALKYCGDANVPLLIRPLAGGNGGADPDNDIKGNALDLLWPKHLTAADLFPLMTPSDDNYFGSYALFETTLPHKLKTADLLPALAWATQLIAQSGHLGDIRRRTLADAIMFKAWQAFDIPELTQPFLEHIAVRVRQHGELYRGSDHDAQKSFTEGLRNDTARRRKFLLALCANALTRIETVSYRHVGLLTGGDLEWLLSIAPGGPEPAPGLNIETLFNLIESAFVADDVAHFEALYVAAERWPALRARYAYLFDGVRLDSPDTARQRAMQEELRALENSLPPPIAPDPTVHILARLGQAEAGRWQAWWELIRYLTLTPQSRSFEMGVDYFITTMPGWIKADETLRRRIAASGEQFLVVAETHINDWLGLQPMPIFWNDLAGVQAFVLLKQVSPEAYDRITKATWRKWAPVIVGFPRATETNKSPEVSGILRDALRYAPAEFVDAVRTIIRLERERNHAADANTQKLSSFFILNDLDGCWDSGPLQDAIYDELSRADSTPAEYAAFLDALLQAGVEQALANALNLLADHSPSTRDRNQTIAEVLLRREPARSWPALKEAMANDDDFARNVLLHVASRYGFGTPFYSGLSAQAITDLYVLMVRLFPRRDDDDHRSGPRFLGALDSIKYVRDSIPRHLAGLGTEAAVAALSALIAAHPEFSDLAYALALAERAMRIATWSPLSAKEVLALSDKPSLKLVTSPADLCWLLVETLEKFGEALHGAQTPVRDLWDRQGKDDVFRPIDENAFSDVVVRYLRSELRDAGIVANREVEVSRAPGAPIGDRTDILVNAIRRRDNGELLDSITGVVETKGCWNRELFTALEAQLFRNYMVRLQAQAGVYLVGWFQTDKWDKKDRRRSRVPKMTIEEAAQKLEHQASELPEGFVVHPMIVECRVP